MVKQVPSGNIVSEVQTPAISREAGQTAPSCPSTILVPEITPEIAERLAQESRAISTEFRKRIERMWDIPSWVWQAPCCPAGRCPHC